MTKRKRTSNTLTDPETGEVIAAPDLSFEGMGLQKPTIRALERMAWEGTSLHLAAEREGIKPWTIQRTLKNERVKSVLNQIRIAATANMGQDALVRVAQLSQTAQSESVRLEGNKWIAGVAGLAPVRRVEGRFNVQHSFGGFAYDSEPIDVTPDADTSSGDQGSDTTDNTE